MFTLFPSLPLEIKLGILSQCNRNDAICLSLTCKSLYALQPSKDIRLDNHELIFQLPADDNLASGLPEVSAWPGPYPWYCPLSIDAHNENAHHTGVCKTRGCRAACACYDCELWTRLRDWMPKGTRYCRHCKDFTKRDKRRKKGACLHHPTASARGTQKNWTYRKGSGGFARNFWKKHYTEADMANAMNRYQRPRKNESKYDLREKPKPTQKRLLHPESRINALQ